VARIDDVVGERGEVAVPRIKVRVPSDQRRFVEHDELVVVAHQLTEALEVAEVDAVDEPNDRGGRWERLPRHLAILPRRPLALSVRSMRRGADRRPASLA
jgi:hypothetical protein